MSVDDVEYRFAAEADIEDLLDLWTAAADGFRMTDTADVVRTLLDADHEACLVAAAPDGRLVGCMIAGWTGYRGHIYRVAVRPEARRQGIAAEMLQRAEERFRKLGATKASAIVVESNDAAQALWDDAGFIRQDHLRQWTREFPST